MTNIETDYHFNEAILTREDVWIAITNNKFADNIMRFIDMLLETDKVNQRALEILSKDTKTFVKDSPRCENCSIYNDWLHNDTGYDESVCHRCNMNHAINQARQETTDAEKKEVQLQNEIKRLKPSCYNEGMPYEKLYNVYYKQKELIADLREKIDTLTNHYTKPCPKCGGSGERNVPQKSYLTGDSFMEKSKCSYCNGTGRIPRMIVSDEFVSTISSWDVVRYNARESELIGEDLGYGSIDNSKLIANLTKLPDGNWEISEVTE